MAFTHLRRLPYMGTVTLLAGLMPVLASLAIAKFAPPPEWGEAWSWTYLFSLPAIVLLGSMSLFVYPAYLDRRNAFTSTAFLIANVVVIDALILGAAIFVWGWPWK